jgi:hypothetical protein
MATVSKDPAALRDAEEIRAGIERARREIEVSVSDLRDEVARTFDIGRWVVAHPAVAFGSALALGFALGYQRKRSRM